MATATKLYTSIELIIPELFVAFLESQQLSAKQNMAIPAMRAEIIPPVSSKGVESKSGTINVGAIKRISPVAPSRIAVNDRNDFIFVFFLEN